MATAQENDIRVVEQLAAGDTDAFRRVYNQYHANVYRYALKFVKSRELAKEIVHDVFLKVWEKREQLNPAFSLEGYLIRICKNHVLNVLLKAAREEAWKKEVLHLAERTANQTEDVVVYADYAKYADLAIAQLPPQRQLIFKMCRLEGKSYEEAAQALGISIGTVRDHMLKAGRTVRQYLSAYTGNTFFELFCLLAAISW